MIDNVLIKQLELFLNYLKKLTAQDLYELEHGISKIGFRLDRGV